MKNNFNSYLIFLYICHLMQLGEMRHFSTI